MLTVSIIINLLLLWYGHGKWREYRDLDKMNVALHATVVKMATPHMDDGYAHDHDNTIALPHVGSKKVVCGQ